ncbi:cupin domain-containing protein [Amycolatopsis sp. 195334CR]|uniref:cupin domain-containing protein n=1 Tax=Amycolatopsis sp. 195334CR TaxID=2814588 RepID=UPI001A8D0FD6|nr:cupin domain-containing protein [Amycolatopsis sp. 195334CR]MBN6038820.1 cupin domain-containing protein [Amycolatopsis sp. 195334CR]
MRVARENGSISPAKVWDGVTVRVVHGELVSMAIAELAPGVVVPQHQHVNEQIGVVLEGSASFVAEGETVELTAGGTYRLLANVPHEVRVGEDGAVFVECFSPVREDWKSLPPAEDAELRWPPAK